MTDMAWETRDPATRPSSMAMRSLARAEKARERRAFFVDLAWWTFAPWTLVAVALLVVFALTGCTTSEAKSEREVIAQMDALLANPCPQDVRWRADRDVARDDAKRFLPQPTPSPSPTPGGGK